MYMTWAVEAHNGEVSGHSWTREGMEFALRKRHGDLRGWHRGLQPSTGSQKKQVPFFLSFF